MSAIVCEACGVEGSVPSDIASHIFEEHDGDEAALNALEMRFRPRTSPNEAPRFFLSPEVEAAARTIHKDVWGVPYRPGASPMNFASGPAHRRGLLRLADRWEKLAAAARVAADALPAEGETDAV